MKKKKQKSAKPGFRQSKSENFLAKLRENNPMIEYFTRLRVLNPPAARLMSPQTEPPREGGFVRLAHANEEFTAPVLTKGKAVLAARRDARKRRAKKRPSK